MVIRQQQLETFELDAEHRFEREMAGHLRGFSPQHAKTLNDEILNRIVSDGVERAHAYGLSSRGAVQFFLETMFILGGQFDSDPQYPWAFEILSAVDVVDPNVKADRLHTRVTDFLDKAGGPERQWAIDAVEKLQAEQKRTWPATGEASGPILNRFKAVYPQKCEYLGDPALSKLIQFARATVVQFGPLTPANHAVFAALMFAFGHKFYDDDLYPWAKATLKSIPEPQPRMDALRAKASAYLEAAAKSARASKT